MDKKKIIFIAFILVALAQIAVPAKMILDSEEVIESGVEYKFKTIPVDPNDPFRGKYIVLRYKENKVNVDNPEDWTVGEAIYIGLVEYSDGYARVAFGSKEKPKDQDFVKATVTRVNKENFSLRIKYPFDRFYMEESKAYPAEVIVREMSRDTNKTTYALVSIKKGEAVLKDVMVDGIAIKELVEEKMNEEELNK